MPFSPAEYADKNGTEYGHQVALFMWANMAISFGLEAADNPASYKVAGEAARIAHSKELAPDNIPALEWLFAIKNAEKGGVVRGSIAKAEGVKTGVPDLCLPVPMRMTFYNNIEGTKGAGAPTHWVDYHGLYIELKRPKSDGKAKGFASGDQAKWQNYLRSVGYVAEVAVGWLEARQIILRYLAIIT